MDIKKYKEEINIIKYIFEEFINFNLYNNLFR